MTTPQDIQSRYLVALAESITVVLDWWITLVAQHGERDVAFRWPRGPASHPRILAIYRAFYAEALGLRESVEFADEPTLPCSPLDDAAWGSNPADAQAPSLLPPLPHELLIDGIAGQYPAFHQFMGNLGMSPVGFLAPPMPSLDEFATLPSPARPCSFELELLHDVERGVLRLLSAPADLRSASHASPTPTWMHHAAHRAYCRDLEPALIEAERCWQGRLRMATSYGRTPKQALVDAYAFTFAGPAADARVLGVIQTYWALCERLNADLPPEHRVAPETLLLDWLRDGQHDSWVRILAGLPYWPIGLDADGNWF